MTTHTAHEKLVLQALERLERDGETITFSTIGEAAGLNQRALSEAWASLLLKGRVEVRPALTNLGHAMALVMSRSAA